MFKFLQGPRREHEPREDGVDEEDEGVGDTSGHTTDLSVSCLEKEVDYTDLLWNFPQALHTAEHVAAPQHEAPKVTSWEQPRQYFRKSDL